MQTEKSLRGRVTLCPKKFLWIESLHHSGGCSSYDGVRWNLAPNQGICADDCAISNRSRAQNDGVIADPHIVTDDHRSASSQHPMSRRLGGLALLISPVDSVIMVGYIDPAPHEDMAANHNALDRRDVYSIGKAHRIANSDCRGEMLRAVRSDSLQPEVAICIDVPAERNMRPPRALLPARDASREP